MPHKITLVSSPLSYIFQEKTTSSSDKSGEKVMASKAQLAKKRSALADITNQKNGSQTGPKTSSFPLKPMVPCMAKIAKTKSEFSACIPSTDISRHTLLESSSSKPTIGVPSSNASLTIRDTALIAQRRITNAPRCIDASPSRSVGVSVYLDGNFSICDSLKCQDFDCDDNEEVSSAVNSIEGKPSNSFCISEDLGKPGSTCNRDVFFDVETTDKVAFIDNLINPQFFATIASDVYKYLRASEANYRPSLDFMERIQKDITASMRAMLIDWLVEVAEEYRLQPDTLFLSVNYIDRYLSGTVMKRQRLQLLGVACMMIAAKYEEITAPHVEEFCYVTDNTYFKEEVLQMESAVLNHLKFEMGAPTAICFLRRFVCVAQLTSEVPSMHMECMANYLAELSLLDYGMLCYAPSLIAASATFLAKYILSPVNKPWNSTLMSYTFYQASDLRECVKALHHLWCSGSNSNLPAIREKYSHHKYKFVAQKYCPLSLPPEFFQDLSH
ncbi:hypothetical protein L484_013386 [Morus notabilis]|uniref:B-like cyclin n=1 Tax=Morus notabilis TaxID=981085 RepID=W9RMB4_9ROSA|nr:cyclin-A1-4 [Morus notabilis]EXB60121.1 hypothetical protein L484_013386 [Morus notabilis]